MTPSTVREETFARHVTMLTCYHCAKLIETKVWFTSHDGFDKAFHPQCWAKAELQAEQELHGKPL